MTSFIYILFYFIVLAEIIWGFTSIKVNLSLIIKLIIAIVGLIPGFHLFFGIIFPVICVGAYNEECFSLKDNWFNRTFLK